MDEPKPRADQVSTAYPSRASSSACDRRSSLLPPKPWASSTAGLRPEPAVKYEVSMRAPGMSSTRSSRWTEGRPSDAAATAAQVPAPASTATAAAADTTSRRPRSRALRRIMSAP
ncbi:hypothetical protein SAZ11_52910 [Streptomyces sp. FXJ1.4098]|nr:hypothetical protein [Streptomyces sp. FXJ1.4098]